jgi:hypothetical protein
MIWTSDDIVSFTGEVLPPGENPQGFDDRYTYEEAIEIATAQGDDGLPLLEALIKKYSASYTEPAPVIIKARTFSQVIQPPV